MNSQFFYCYPFFRAVCRNKKGEYLLIKENENLKLPEATFDSSGRFTEIVKNKLSKMANNPIIPKGILKISHAVSKDNDPNLKIKIMYYCESDSSEKIEGSILEWVTPKEIQNNLEKYSEESRFWISYLENKGSIKTLEFLDDEGSEPKENLKNSFKIS